MARIQICFWTFTERAEDKIIGSQQSKHGRSRHDALVRMFGFVSGKFTGGPCPHQHNQTCRAERVPVGLKILRISEEDYRDFLRRWVEWMQGAGLAKPHSLGWA